MEENKGTEMVLIKKKRVLKKTPYRRVRMNLTLTEQEATEMGEEAVKVGCRSVGAKLVCLKPHGFNNETYYNTKGITKFIRKFLFPAWKKAEAERMIKKRELEKQAGELGLKVG
jgi:ribosomal protein L32E